MNAIELRNYFSNKQFKYSQLHQLLQDKNLYDELYNMYSLNYKERFSFKVFVKYYILNIADKKCLKCGRLLTYSQLKDNRSYCSSKCSNNSETVKNKIKTSLLNHYGFEHAAQSEYIKQKMKQTNLERRGCCWAMQNEEVKNKSKSTCLEKYGFDYATKNNQILQKIFQTNMKKYNCKTMLYNKELHDKVNKQNMIKAISKLIDICKDYVIPMFKIQDYNGYNNNQIYKWKCVKCGNEFEQHIKTTCHSNIYRYMPRCLKCYPYIQQLGFSKSEKQLLKFIKSICNDTIIQNSKDIIFPYQLDIYIPQKKIAIEFDGLYWHSDKFKKDTSQLKKTQMCQLNGIQLIHIFQDTIMMIYIYMMYLCFNQNSLTAKRRFSTGQTDSFVMVLTIPPSLPSRCSSSNFCP